MKEKFYCDLEPEGGDNMKGIESLVDSLDPHVGLSAFCEGSTGGGQGPEPPPGSPCQQCMCQGEG